jgi:hypothetical protein
MRPQHQLVQPRPQPSTAPLRHCNGSIAWLQAYVGPRDHSAAPGRTACSSLSAHMRCIHALQQPGLSLRLVLFAVLCSCCRGSHNFAGKAAFFPCYLSGLRGKPGAKTLAAPGPRDSFVCGARMGLSCCTLPWPVLACPGDSCRQARRLSTGLGIGSRLTSLNMANAVSFWGCTRGYAGSIQHHQLHASVVTGKLHHRVEVSGAHLKALGSATNYCTMRATPVAIASAVSAAPPV